MTRTKTAVENLRQGVRKMDESLSPLSRALRKLRAGRPSKQAIDTPLGAVVLAVEQRERLAGFLAEAGASLVRTVIVVEVTVSGISIPIADWVDVAKGEESVAVAFLEATIRGGSSFVVAGLKFVVEGEKGHDESRVVDYAVDRTPEGLALLGKCDVFHVRKRSNR